MAGEVVSHSWRLSRFGLSKRTIGLDVSMLPRNAVAGAVMVIPQGGGGDGCSISMFT